MKFSCLEPIVFGTNYPRATWFECHNFDTSEIISSHQCTNDMSMSAKVPLGK